MRLSLGACADSSLEFISCAVPRKRGVRTKVWTYLLLRDPIPLEGKIGVGRAKINEMIYADSESYMRHAYVLEWRECIESDNAYVETRRV